MGPRQSVGPDGRCRAEGVLVKSSEPSRPPDRAPRALIDLRILATTDLHAHVLPYDYYHDAPVGNLGLARLADQIAAARAGAENSLMFDNGDFLQGSAMGDLVAASGLPAGAIHPMIAAMNAVGYDAVTLGNHEFNFGLDHLEAALRGATFPVVLANAVRRRGSGPLHDLPFQPPCRIVDRIVTDRAGRRHPLRVGILGLVTPQIATWDRDHLAGRIETRDSIETARAWVPWLRGAGADLIVVLSHFGIAETGWQAGMEDAAIPLARLCDIDVQILGHSHLQFPSVDYAAAADTDILQGLVGGKPAVMAGAFGSHLGQIDLTLKRGPDGITVVSSRTSVIAPDGAARPGPRQRAIERLVATAHRRTLAQIRRPVGTTTLPIDSYFALVAPDAALGLVAEAQRDHVVRSLADGPWAGLPVLSAVSPFKAGGRGGAGHYTDIPAGELALRHIADLYSFPNAIRALRVSGAGLSEWLERSAALFHRLEPGAADAPLIDPDIPSYDFDVLHGLSYGFDLSQPRRYGPRGHLADPRARRVTGLTHAGGPVRPDQQFIVATNSYRTSGGGGFPCLPKAEEVLRQPLLNRDLLACYVTRLGTVVPRRDPVWYFRPMPGTTAIFDSGPGAQQALTGPLPPEAVRLTSLGPLPDGFHRFRLHL